MGNWFEPQLSISFLHHWRQPCLCFVGYDLFRPPPLLTYTLPLSFRSSWFQLNSSLLGPNISKHTVISHQHQSKLLWFSLSLEKEAFLYFPIGTRSSLLSAAADIVPSFQLPFLSLFPWELWISVWQFICYFKGMYYVIAAPTFVLF